MEMRSGEMIKVKQGDVLKVPSIQYPVVVVSKNFFNESGLVMACPILPETVRSPLRIRCESIRTPGYVYCDQVRSVDLNKRRFTKIDVLSYYELIDIADAIQGIFDYV